MVNKGCIFKNYIDGEKGCRIWESIQEEGTELIRVNSKDLGVAFDICDLAKQLGFPKESWYEHQSYVSMTFDVGTYKSEILGGNVWL